MTAAEKPQASVPPRRRLVRSFQVLAKPIGPQCNLDCTYCYYLHKQELLPDTAGGPISEELLEEFTRQSIVGHDGDSVCFTWHGGEPMLLGLDFYRKVIQLQQKYARSKRIANDLQTNGSLLDNSWCEFLQEHRFLVGLSVDGPQHLHDHFRRMKGGGSSFEQVCRAARLLREHGVTFNTLSVVNAVTARHPREVYEFLTRELGSRRLQWLPCVQPKDFRTTAPGQWDQAQIPVMGTTAARPGHPDSVVTEWSVDPDDWGEFLCQTFELWHHNDQGKVLVNWFESLVGQWMRRPAQICVLAEVCGRSLAVERDGSVYSCDHYVYPEYKLGHLGEKDRQLVDMVYSPQQRRFGCNKRDTLPPYCKQCPYGFVCNGECPKNRFIKTPDGQPGLNYLCSGLKRFFTHADPFIRSIVAQLPRSVSP